MDDSWLVVMSTILWVLIVAKVASPPGPSYTAVWLFVGFQGCLLKSESTLRCFYIGGSGLIFGWYGAQMVDGSVWPRILNIWIPKFPWAPRGALSATVRVLDLYIHALPFFVAAHWSGGFAGFLPWLQALMIERSYFLIIDNNILGDGAGVNEVYQIQPRASPRFFWTMQSLSLLGQVLTVTNELLYGVAPRSDVDLYFRDGWTTRHFTPLMYWSVAGVIAGSVATTHAKEVAPVVERTYKPLVANAVKTMFTKTQATTDLFHLMVAPFIR